MKIMTNKKFEDEINNRLSKIEERRWRVDHIDKLEKETFSLDDRIQKLAMRIDAVEEQMTRTNLAIQVICERLEITDTEMSVRINKMENEIFRRRMELAKYIVEGDK